MMLAHVQGRLAVSSSGMGVHLLRISNTALGLACLVSLMRERACEADICFFFIKYAITMAVDLEYPKRQLTNTFPMEKLRARSMKSTHSSKNWEMSACGRSGQQKPWYPKPACLYFCGFTLTSFSAVLRT